MATSLILHSDRDRPSYTKEQVGDLLGEGELDFHHIIVWRD